MTGTRPSVRRAVRRLASDLRAGWALLAGELRQSGWLDFGAFRWRDLAVNQAVRAAVGVITPLVIGVVTGKIEYGSYAALGALPAGFVSFRGVSRTRVVAVFLAAAGMSLSTFTGATTAQAAPWLLVPVVLIWAYAAGLIASLGPTALAVSLQWPVALLIGSALPLAPGPAAIRAALVLAGGLWQCVLVVSSWTVNRGSAERAALAASYSSLAGYAADLAAGRQGPPAPRQLAGTYALADPNPLVRTAARLHMLDLARESERIRATLTALGTGWAVGSASASGRRVLTEVAAVLREISSALTGRPQQRRAHLSAAVGALSEITVATGTRWQWAGEALLGQLRSACRIAARLQAVESTGGDRAPLAPIGQGWIRDARLTVRASLGTSSETGRHALRLAVLAALAEIIVQATGLGHGYWAVLTVFIVLRPDYSSTLYRGLQRAAGTVVGAGLGVATVQLTHVGQSALLAGIAISLVAAYAVFTVNFLLYAVFLTDFVVVLLALLGLPPEPTALARLAGTAIGTGIAVLGYVLWPTWEGTSAAEKFARLYTAQGRYAVALLRTYTRPDKRDARQLGSLQLAARRARIDAEASADRLAGQPDHPPVTAALARALASAGHRIALALLTLSAVPVPSAADLSAESMQERPATASRIPLQASADQLAIAIEVATQQLADSLRDGADSVGLNRDSLPRLRPLQQSLLAAAGTGPGGAIGSSTAALADATDGLVDAIDTAADVLANPAIH